MDNKIYWNTENDGSIFGFRYPLFHIYENEQNKGEWILLYRRNPKVKIRELILTSLQQCKIIANKLKNDG